MPWQPRLQGRVAEVALQSFRRRSEAQRYRQGEHDNFLHFPVYIPRNWKSLLLGVFRNIVGRISDAESARGTGLPPVEPSPTIRNFLATPTLPNTLNVSKTIASWHFLANRISFRQAPSDEYCGMEALSFCGVLRESPSRSSRWGALSASANEAKREGTERVLYIGASAASRALFHHYRPNSRRFEDNVYSLAFALHLNFILHTHSVSHILCRMATPGGEALPDTNNAQSYIIVCGIFLALAVGLCVARIYSRIRPKLIMRVEDYFIIIPTVISYPSPQVPNTIIISL